MAKYWQPPNCNNQKTSKNQLPTAPCWKPTHVETPQWWSDYLGPTNYVSTTSSTLSTLAERSRLSFRWERFNNWFHHISSTQKRTICRFWVVQDFGVPVCARRCLRIRTPGCKSSGRSGSGKYLQLGLGIGHSLGQTETKHHLIRDQNRQKIPFLLLVELGFKTTWTTSGDIQRSDCWIPHQWDCINDRSANKYSAQESTWFAWPFCNDWILPPPL